MERQRIITITPEENKYLQNVFGVSGVTVWQAVKYIKNNDLHKRIREAAIERGAPQMVLAREFDTIMLINREDADKGMTRYMVQTFRSGATLEGNFTTGKVMLRNKRGYVVHTYTNPTLTELKAIQEVAMSF